MDETFYDDYKEALLDIIDNNIPIVYNLNVGHATPRAIVPLAFTLMWIHTEQVIRFDYNKNKQFLHFLCFGIDFRYNLCLNLLHFAYFYDIFF